MIRTLQRRDLDRVMEIWVQSNLQAHYFIDSNYWLAQKVAVRKMIPQAEVYVAQVGEEVQGFIGVDGDTIEGIFVDIRYQGTGIGHQLITAVKEKHAVLYLQVYKKNKRAVIFYEREGFSVIEEQNDSATNEQEFTMQWSAPEKKAKNE